ncbi:MAG: gamma-glutamyltransferase [Pseudomonadota bacterium]
MRLYYALLAFLLLPITVFAQEAADAVQPEAAGTGAFASSPEAEIALKAKQAGLPVKADDWMVVAANPLAVEAGAKILRAGGSAADAMIAVQAVLGLVEPQSSGLGGGAFLVWYDGASGTMTTLDGRETAPLAATPRLFQDEDGQPLRFFDAVVGGGSVGVPGVPLLLEEAYARWGRADWRTLFEDAIAHAEDGFAVSPRMATMIDGDSERLATFRRTRNYFLPDGTPLQEGQILTNPDYAQSLRILARDGAAPFYTGKIASDIVAAVRTAPINPGLLSREDLALYRVKEREAVCGDYRGYKICGMGPPSSGALAVGQILGLLEPFDMSGLGPENADSWRLIGDASRLAFADRGRYVADTDFVPVPVEGMLDSSYLAERSKLLHDNGALETVDPGSPEYDHALNWADDDAIELPSTSHISIVDRYGNVLSMTTTIENAFGSRLMARGFLLNNELTDFSFRSHRDGLAIANRVEPGKRPRSSMAPTIVLKDGKPVLAIGSPGGSRIIGYVAKSIVAHLDWGMDVQQAVSLPHLVNRFGTYDVEQGTKAETFAQPLVEMGFEVEPRPLTSGLSAISLGEVLRGGADPRREGIALGE